MASGSQNFLNLTLDEIIQQKRMGGRNQPVKRNVPQARQRKIWKGGTQHNGRMLSIALANRLQKGGRDFKGTENPFTFKRGNRGTTRVQNRLGLQARQRRPVHNRLALNNQMRMPLNSLPYKMTTQFYRPPQLNDPVKHMTSRRHIKTKHSEDSLPVRITNGAIVKGLRSDQLLLQKLRQQRSSHLSVKMDKLRSLKAEAELEKALIDEDDRSDYWSGSSKVSLNYNRGLTISIPNEIVRKDNTRKKKHHRPSTPSSSSSDEPYPLPKVPRRSNAEVNPQESLGAPSLLRIGLERPPPPKPHRQVLDPQVQKEIAALQGRQEATQVGPGPGVKGFKMVPNRTRHSLNGRFTLERNGLD